MYWFSNLNPIIQALLAATFTWLVTALGALSVCFFKKINDEILTIVLGFSSGVMLAASFFSLILPAINLCNELGKNEWLFPSIGFVIGGLFVLLSDNFLDKIISGSKKRNALLLSAITIHNIPEGMAIGVAFGGIATGNITLIGAMMLALGIGIQNFPEGAAVSLPLRSSGNSKTKSFILGQASALVEPISAVIGALLVLIIRNILPFLLSFAAGAMIVVTARELLPESVKINKNLSTYGVIAGFIIMLILDVSLG